MRMLSPQDHGTEVFLRWAWGLHLETARGLGAAEAPERCGPFDFVRGKKAFNMLKNSEHW